MSTSNVLQKLYDLHAVWCNKKITMLMYHSIADDKNDPWSTTPRSFMEQMDWLTHNKFKILSLDQAIDQMAHNKNNKKCVVITFDDGYKDFLDNAVPILKKNNFTATLFVPTEMIGHTSQWDSFNKNKQLLHWQELKEVARLGYGIGSHTKTHPDLTTLNDQQLLSELVESKQRLESELNMKISSFSYPFGKYAEREIEAVKKAGYSSAVTVHANAGNDSKTNVFEIERIAISVTDSLHDFELKVSGRKKAMRILCNYIKIRSHANIT